MYLDMTHFRTGKKDRSTSRDIFKLRIVTHHIGVSIDSGHYRTSVRTGMITTIPTTLTTFTTPTISLTSDNKMMAPVGVEYPTKEDWTAWLNNKDRTKAEIAQFVYSNRTFTPPVRSYVVRYQGSHCKICSYFPF